MRVRVGGKTVQVGEMPEAGKMKVRRRDKRIWFVGLGVFAAVFLFTFLAGAFKSYDEEVEAASLANFDPGYIISDYQMSNYNSMSVAEIQAFLSSKNACNNTNIGMGVSRGYENYSDASGVNYNYWIDFGGSVGRYHVENGKFVCMANEKFNGKSAAEIIYEAAHDYKINPQVLLVLLQKEQGLITDDYPNHIQYRGATGYGCPDTAACSSKYYGLRNQVRNAAALFRTVLDGGWTNYPLGNNYIQYSPNAACGGSVVNIRSLATSALYRYTPYRPNAGALAAGYGTAYCGAYGNRNFYLYFSDWFGNITWDGYPGLSTIKASVDKIADLGSDIEMQYRTHLEHYGWLDWTRGAKAVGSVGYSVQVEALQFKLSENVDGGVEYRAHVADRGWLSYVSDGEMAGTTGKSLQVEAIQIRLTGEIAKRYDVYYRVHVAERGWLEWVKNDEVAGTTGESLRVEAIQIRLVKKELDNGPEYQAHVQNYGWMSWVKNGEIAGMTGESKRMEAVKIEVSDGTLGWGGIKYQAHVQNYGWMSWVKNGEIAGTTGESLRVEAIKIELTGELAEKYDVYYRAHVQDIGWMSWVKNGEIAGTTGESRRLEAVEIELVKKYF